MGDRGSPDGPRRGRSSRCHLVEPVRVGPRAGAIGMNAIESLAEFLKPPFLRHLRYALEWDEEAWLARDRVNIEKHGSGLLLATHEDGQESFFQILVLEQIGIVQADGEVAFTPLGRALLKLGFVQWKL